MLRLNLFLAGILFAGVGTAQETSDPAAAAPVVYGEAATAGCGSGTYATHQSPVRCSETEATDGDDADYAPDAAVDAESGEYVGDAPVYVDTTDYYPGVSLYPDDYWVPGFGFGWPYYAYAPFAYGWPYYGFGFSSWGWGWGWSGFGFAWWGGHHHHDNHHGWHDHPHYATHGYPGPYRYLGHGRYANQVRTASGAHSAIRADRGTARTTLPATAQHTSGTRAGLLAPQRAALPSASYYSTARRGGLAPRGISVDRPGASSRRSTTMVNRAGMAPLRSRGYAPSNYSRERVAYPASRGYAVHNRGVPSYAPSYRIPNRGYSSASRASYSHAAALPARSATGSPMSHGGGGSPAHASTGGTHSGSATPHRH